MQSLSAAPVEPRDTTKVVDVEEIVIVASPKENTKFRQQALSSSVFSREQLHTNQVTSIKNVTSLVPNFYMPDYGSKLTSAVYIRGIGSRINTPAVGLYVDNIPYLDKSAFDFNLYDIERIDVLRGPQSTLYGRNAMGGLMRIYTRNPFRYQGTQASLGFSSGNNSYSKLSFIGWLSIVTVSYEPLAFLAFTSIDSRVFFLSPFVSSYIFPGL